MVLSIPELHKVYENILEIIPLIAATFEKNFLLKKSLLTQIKLLTLKAKSQLKNIYLMIIKPIRIYFKRDQF